MDFIASLFTTETNENRLLALQYLANALSLIIKQPDNHNILHGAMPYFAYSPSFPHRNS